MWAQGLWKTGTWRTGLWTGEESAVPPAPTFGGGGSTEDQEYRLHRDHWDYMDSLRAIQVRIADDVRGARTISIPLQMPIPKALDVRAMRGTVADIKAPPVAVADILGEPLLLAALALLIDEADD